jgi:hypothetical protein
MNFRKLFTVSILLTGILSGALAANLDDIVNQIRTDETAPKNGSETPAVVSQPQSVPDFVYRQTVSQSVTRTKKQSANPKNLPASYNSAKAWMIEHFDIPDNANIINFSALGNPVYWAEITWKTITVTQTGGGAPMGTFKALQRVETSVDSHYHTRGYNFVNQTMTDQSDS